jgi:hypothetical protein
MAATKLARQNSFGRPPDGPFPGDFPAQSRSAPRGDYFTILTARRAVFQLARPKVFDEFTNRVLHTNLEAMGAVSPDVLPGAPRTQE